MTENQSVSAAAIWAAAVATIIIGNRKTRKTWNCSHIWDLRETTVKTMKI